MLTDFMSRKEVGRGPVSIEDGEIWTESYVWVTKTTDEWGFEG